MTTLQTAWLVFYYFLFVRLQKVTWGSLVFSLIFIFNLHYFGGLQHWSVIMQKNDQAYLLYSIETTVSRVGFGLRRHLRFQFFFFYF